MKYTVTPITGEYEYIAPFRGDRAVVYTKDRMTMNIISVSNGEKYGIADKDGRIVTPMEYDNSISWYSGYAVTKKDGQWMILEIEE